MNQHPAAPFAVAPTTRYYCSMREVTSDSWYPLKTFVIMLALLESGDENILCLKAIGVFGVDSVIVHEGFK